MAELSRSELAAQKKIYGLNLRQIMQRVRKNQRWSAKRAKDAEHWYKNFLWMCYLNRKRPVAALGRDADLVWHNHILNTERYQKDCKTIFGGYLNHRPILRKLTKADEESIEETIGEAYELFGSVPRFMMAGCINP
ncbi:MAG: hypothetical protein AUG06_10945 [Actinobacteria bacterium 13_1_20CM_2_65_11]|nr:MAG: hypothetical protein AUH40_04340 [Chloroflexi bacterium 13_1_40CM_65_17]OLE78359.1 MAG: hypothetical protein AUG06_10945 [Actinobacteria bacterium 13_1_20CM_2_65_11]